MKLTALAPGGNSCPAESGRVSWRRATTTPAFHPGAHQVGDLVAYIRAGLPSVPGATPRPVITGQGPCGRGRAPLPAVWLRQLPRPEQARRRAEPAVAGQGDPSAVQKPASAACARQYFPHEVAILRGCPANAPALCFACTAHRCRPDLQRRGSPRSASAGRPRVDEQQPAAVSGGQPSETETDPGPPARLTRGLAQAEHSDRPLAVDDG